MQLNLVVFFLGRTSVQHGNNYGTKTQPKQTKFSRPVYLYSCSLYTVGVIKES